MNSCEKPQDTDTEAGDPLKPTSPTTSKIVWGTSGETDNTVPIKRRVVIGKREGRLGQRSDGAAEPLSVIGDDERSRIRETEIAPYRMICALKIDSPWGRFVGTGWLAGPRTVITAGHCVFDRNQMGGWAKSIEVTPGRDADEPPVFGTHTAKRFSTVDNWRDGRDPDFDIGVIHLEEPADERLGFFSVAAFTDDQLIDYMVNVSGYPARPGGGVQQWWAMNRIRALTARRIFYDVDTSGGQSGGPVYIYEEEKLDVPIVVGIHAYGIGGTPTDIPLLVNSAPRLIPEVVEQIETWVTADVTDN